MVLYAGVGVRTAHGWGLPRWADCRHRIGVCLLCWLACSLAVATDGSPHPNPDRCTQPDVLWQPGDPAFLPSPAPLPRYEFHTSMKKQYGDQAMVFVRKDLNHRPQSRGPPSVSPNTSFTAKAKISPNQPPTNLGSHSPTFYPIPPPFPSGPTPTTSIPMPYHPDAIPNADPTSVPAGQSSAPKPEAKLVIIPAVNNNVKRHLQRALSKRLQVVSCTSLCL